MERKTERESVIDRGRVTKPIGCWDRACGKRVRREGKRQEWGGIQATC